MNQADLSFHASPKYKWVLSLSMAGFFFLFLVYFQPFGVNNYDPRNHYSLIFVASMLSFLAMVLVLSLANEFLLRSFLKGPVTMNRILLWSGWTLILLSEGNFLLYNLWGDWHDFRLMSALAFIANCSSVLIFPMVGVFFFFRFKGLQKRFDQVLTNNESQFDPDQIIVFTGQGSNDQLALSLSVFQYARAQDNYVELYYLEKNKMTKFLIRASLASVAEAIDHPAIVRCHRSYLVNLLQVQSIKGGTSDLKLYIAEVPQPLPVSKSYREEVMQALRKVKNFI